MGASNRKDDNQIAAYVSDEVYEKYLALGRLMKKKDIIIQGVEYLYQTKIGKGSPDKSTTTKKPKPIEHKTTTPKEPVQDEELDEIAKIKARMEKMLSGD